MEIPFLISLFNSWDLKRLKINLTSNALNYRFKTSIEIEFQAKSN